MKITAAATPVLDSQVLTHNFVLKIGSLCRVAMVVFPLPAGLEACHQPGQVTTTSESQVTTGPLPTAPSDSAAIIGKAPHEAAYVHPGTGALIQTPAMKVEPAPIAPGDDVTLNFVETDIRDVLHSVLGDLLHVNYIFDPKLQATITVQTSRPLRRDQVLPTLQEILRTSGLALIETSGIYRVVPLDDAAHHPSGAVVLGQGAHPAIGTVNAQIMPLKFVAAADLRQTIEPIMPKGTSVQVDTTRNLLILTGASEDLTAVIDLVKSFDVDWLASMSYAIYPLETSTPREVVADLNSVFSAGGTAPLAGVLRFQALDRMNAVLVVAPQRAYLDEARRWIERFDRGDDETTPRLFEYHVQNSRAGDLAKVISQLFTTSSVQTVQAQTAPGTTPAQLAAPTETGGLGTNSNASLGSQTLSTGAAMPGGLGAGPTTQAETDTGSLTAALKTTFGSENETASGLDLPKLRVVADERNNTLIVFAKPRDYRMLEQTLQRLDVVPLQVLIEATIAEVTLNDDLQYGLQWFFTKGNHKFELTQASNGTSTASDIAGSFPGFNYVFGGTNTKVVLSALSAVTKVNVVSAPELLALDHRTSTLQVGDQVPVITQTSQSTLTSNASVISSVQYVNTGVVLQVTPQVNSSGVVTLDIDQSVSDVGKTTTSGIDSPTITQRRIVTSAVVKDGETIALGGLILQNQQNDHSGVPFLSSIPVVSTLFSTQTHNNDRTELLVLLTPRIVRDSTEARAMTNELRVHLDSLKPLLAAKP